MSKQLVTGIAGAVVGGVIVWLGLVQLKPQQKGSRTLTIGVYKYGADCEVDFPSAVVSRGRKEKVGWQSQDTDQDYTIIFQPSAKTGCNYSGTPFNTGTIYVPKASGTSNPPPTGYQPMNSGDYCYEVFKGNYTSIPAPPASLCNDPGLHVKD